MVLSIKLVLILTFGKVIKAKIRIISIYSKIYAFGKINANSRNFLHLILILLYLLEFEIINI